MNTFKIGDLVEWTTSCRAKDSVKTGKVVAHVPANTSVEKLYRDFPDRIYSKALIVRPLFRNVDAYLIQGNVDNKLKGKLRLYFPNPDLLRLKYTSIGSEDALKPNTEMFEEGDCFGSDEKRCNCGLVTHVSAGMCEAYQRGLEGIEYMCNWHHS